MFRTFLRGMARPSHVFRLAVFAALPAFHTFCAAPVHAAPTTLTIATINNPDMIVLQKLSSQFEQAHPDIKLRWVTLEEGVLRQRVTTDIATGSGQFDLMTIGGYEAPLWAKKGWLVRWTCPPATTRPTCFPPCERACRKTASCTPCRSMPKAR